MNYWNLWLIVLAPSYERIITSSLANEGFQVTALSGSTVSPKQPESYSGITLAYSLGSQKSLSCEEVNNLVTQKLDQYKMFYFALIVTEGNIDCSWRPTNISYPEDPKKVFNRIIN